MDVTPGTALPDAPVAPSSRRAFLRRAAVVGTVAYVVPAAEVLSMTASTASAASGEPGSSTTSVVVKLPEPVGVERSVTTDQGSLQVTSDPQSAGATVTTPSGSTTGASVDTGSGTLTVPGAGTSGRGSGGSQG